MSTSTYRPGRGWALVGERCATLLAEPPEPALRDRLWRAVSQGGAVEALAALGQCPQPPGGYVVAGVCPGGVRVVAGPGTVADVDLRDGSREVVAGAMTQAVTDVIVAQCVGVTMSCRGPSSSAGPAPRSEPAEPDLPVVAGVVRADQVTWVVPAEASVEHPAPPPPPSARRRSVEDAAVRTPEDLDGEAGHLDLSRSMPLPAPAMSGAARTASGQHPTSPHASGHADTVYGLLPDPARAQVSAVFCPNGHPSPHGSPVCRDCAVRIVDPTPHLLPRPRLGTLRFSSGQTVSLDRSVLIGRNPMAMRVSGDEFPTIIPLRHAGQDVSRTHVEIRLVEWSVLLIDLGSRNGTMVTIPGRTRLRLEAHRPIELIPGTVVQLADDVTFVFEVQR